MSFEEVSILATPTFSLEVDDTDLTSVVVGDCHLANLLDVGLAEDKIFDERKGSLDPEVFTSTLQDDMFETERSCL